MRLGFSPDDVQFVYLPAVEGVDAPDGQVRYAKENVVSVVLSVQALEFVWVIGPTDVRKESIETAWRETADFWNETYDDPEAGWRYEHSFEARERGDVIHALARKGFTIPTMPEVTVN